MPATKRDKDLKDEILCDELKRVLKVISAESTVQLREFVKLKEKEMEVAMSYLDKPKIKKGIKNKSIRVRCKELNTGVTFIPKKIEFSDTGEPICVWRDEHLNSYRFPKQLDILSEEI